MIRTTLALALALLALPASAGDFITNPAATLPANTRGTKTNIRALPGGADPTKYIEAADYNEHTSRIDAANGALLDIQDAIGGTINVKAFGCVGDGVANDTACLQAAVAAASRAALDTDDWGQGKGGRVVLPRGTYLLTAPLTWSADSVWLVGEGANATSIKVALTVNPATTDAITIGDGTGSGRRSGMRDLSVYADGGRAAVRCRDLVVIDSSSWWRLENMHLYGASRYGLRIRGTLHGSVVTLRSAYNGDSGLRIEDSSTGVGQTTTSLFHYYGQNNTKHGAHVAHGHVVNFFGPILEFNGDGGTAAEGNGLRVGDTGIDQESEVNLFGAYFEANAGWDIHTGTGLTGSHFHVVNSYASMASGPKTSGYGFFYGNRAKGGSYGIARLSGYTVAENGGATFSLDSTCRFSIRGFHDNINETNAPVFRDTTANQYNGWIEWNTTDNAVEVWGRYKLRAGGAGSGASIALRRSGAAPVDGTCAVGDTSFSTSGSRGAAAGWRCITAGTPGTWVPTSFAPSVSGDVDVNSSPTYTTPIEPVLRVTTALTADRTVTLSTTGAERGQVVRISRTAGSTGGPWKLTAQGVVLHVNTWADFGFDGTAWRHLAFGSITATGLRATSTTDLGNIATNACTDTTITVTGAVVGGECITGTPAGFPSQVITSCHIESGDTVHAHVCNFGAPYDPPSATYSVRVFNP